MLNEMTRLHEFICSSGVYPTMRLQKGQFCSSIDPTLRELGIRHGMNSTVVHQRKASSSIVHSIT